MRPPPLFGQDSPLKIYEVYHTLNGDAGLIFMVPIAPFGIYGIVAQLSHGMVALVYAIGLSGMMFTAFSYWRLAEVFPLTGSVYAYTSRGINKEIGFLSGWIIELDYLLLPSLLYVVSAVALNAIIPAVPIPAWIAAKFIQ